MLLVLRALAQAHHRFAGASGGAACQRVALCAGAISVGGQLRSSLFLRATPCHKRGKTARSEGEKSCAVKECRLICSVSSKLVRHSFTGAAQARLPGVTGCGLARLSLTRAAKEDNSRLTRDIIEVLDSLETHFGWNHALSHVAHLKIVAQKTSCDEALSTCASPHCKP